MNVGRATCAVTLALCVGGALPSGAHGQAVDDPGTSPQEHAEAVLANAQELLGPHAAADEADPNREVTLVLTELSSVAHDLDQGDRRRAHSILARPDDGPGDRYGDGYTVDEADDSPACTANFCVHWVAVTQDKPNLTDTNGTTDGDGVPDFVEAVQTSAEESFAVENTSLGWVEPLSDGVRGGGGAGRTDIYLLETGGRYFGYASPDKGQPGATSRAGYLVLDNDYAEFADDVLSKLEALQVTMAHEYNHVLQFTYDAREDLWMLESTATWMEEQVYPAIDDYLRYVPAFAESTGVPLTANTPDQYKIYGAAFWNQYLEGTFEADAIRTAWENSDTVTPPSLSVAAYDSAVGGTGANPFEPLGDRFAQFASASAEWRALPALFADASDLPDAGRRGRLRAGGPAARVELDHLSYALLKVRPAAAAGDLALKARGPAGIQYAIDLVTRAGTATGGAVVFNTTILDDGGPAIVNLGGGNYSRVTAAITNADASVNASRRYLSDGTAFKLRLVSAP